MLLVIGNVTTISEMLLNTVLDIKKKGDAISDLEKAKKYLDFEIQTLKKGTKDEFK